MSKKFKKKNKNPNKKFHFHNSKKNNPNNNIFKKNQDNKNNKNNPNNKPIKKSSKEILSSKISNSLDDAKFRLLNEKLYKSSSAEALNYFQSNLDDFITYHKGFSSQAKKWPSNPNNLILKSLLLPKYKKMAIADIGCGEGALA